MAEATLVETEVTPANDAAVAVPESPPESAPAPENPEVETSFSDAFLESIEAATKEDAGKDGQNAASDAVVPPAQPSEAEIEARVRTRVDNENRFKGLKQVAMESGPAALQKFAPLDPEERREFDYIINQMKGAVAPLADRAVDVDQNYAPQIKTAALKEAEDFTFNQFAEVAKDLGINLAESRANFRSWQDIGKALVTAARKDMVSKADYVSKAAVKENSEKLEQSLKERGAAGIVTSSLKELMGSTGPDTPAATGGVGRLKVGTPEWAENASIQELIAAKAKGLY